tara:strand:+ start:173 stop:379 length:207 start_codon:yes stop_codon:yes gene_type:complete
MIKRHYFIAVEKPHNDGRGSYSFDSTTLDYTSWIPNPKKVYNDAEKYFYEKMDHITGDTLQVISFNIV